MRVRLGHPSPVHARPLLGIESGRVVHAGERAMPATLLPRAGSTTELQLSGLQTRRPSNAGWSSVGTVDYVVETPPVETLLSNAAASQSGVFAKPPVQSPAREGVDRLTETTCTLICMGVIVANVIWGGMSGWQVFLNVLRVLVPFVSVGIPFVSFCSSWMAQKDINKDVAKLSSGGVVDMGVANCTQMLELANTLAKVDVVAFVNMEGLLVETMWSGDQVTEYCCGFVWLTLR